VAANLTQAELAERAGLSAQAISLLERGARRAPRTSTIELLSTALMLDPSRREALVAAARQAPGPELLAAPPPREVPRPPADFTGRAAELTTLREPCGSETVGGGRPVVISTIDGMGGIGKSALAIHAAHELAPAFPDGQLYVDLQGATPGLPPLDPLAALGRVLRSLGLEPGAIPATVAERAARFRSLAAGRRLLVLLDNAADAEQVRPLLPGGPTSVVLVTSRRPLVTLEGARALHLGLLPEADGLALLARIAGPVRVAAEPMAAAEVVRACGGLPLAIRIAGARLAGRPRWPVRLMADRLADVPHRLETLQAGELVVRTCFDISLRALSEGRDPVDRAASAAFALLSLPDGPDIGVTAAARLLEQSETTTNRLLEHLVDEQLLESPRAGRYQFHGLMRLYARESAVRRHPERERRAALMRLIDFYRLGAWRAVAVLRPGDPRPCECDAGRTSDGPVFADASVALAWLDAERANLLAAVAQATCCPTASIARRPPAGPIERSASSGSVEPRISAPAPRGTPGGAAAHRVELRASLRP
jgi:transcriptional regulator with XRE-family HTH domain